MKKLFAMMIMLCALFSTGCSADKTAPTINLVQKSVVVPDSKYDPPENILSVEDDVDGNLKYSKEKDNVAGKYTIERRNVCDYGYTAVVTATDKAGNTATKKFSVAYDDLIDDVIKKSNLNPTDTDGTENSNHNSVAHSNEENSTIKESTANYNSGTSEETSDKTPALLEEKKKQLDTPYVRSEVFQGVLYVSWPAVDNADYYLVSLDGGTPKEIKITSSSYEADELGGRESSNHTITVQACKYYHSEFVNSEAVSINIQFEPQLKTVSVMYFQGESTYVDSGNPTVDVYVGMDYTYQELDSMAGGFAVTSQRTLNNPTGIVHIYDTTTSVQIYLNEQQH